MPGTRIVRRGGTLPRRPLGKGGVELSIIGLGGIVVSGLPRSEVERILGESLDRGVNYIDIAPTYGDAEERLGPVLKPHRQKVFLACKTHKRTAKEAAGELRESLQRLRTDHFDLYQLHALTKLEDVERVFARGGAMEAFVEAKEKGLVRFLGFSAHSVKAALEAMRRFPFDTVLFPINFVLYRNGFGPQVVAEAGRRGVAVLAIKSMAKTLWPRGKRRTYRKCWYWPIDDPSLASLALRFTLSEPVVAAIPPGDERLYLMALDIVSRWERFEPLSGWERAILKEAARGLRPIFRLDS